MCGIIGVTGVRDAARVAYLGLYSLQHRGQESAGMVAVDGEGVARSHRGMGLVSDIFNERVLSDLPGDVAIGHTRYSTAGTSVLANAQPMLARYREGPLALAHNGNLTNAVQLRSDLVAKGSIFQSSSDSEVLVHLIARSEAREPEDQLLDALERVEGAYSLVITIGRTLYAIVDPRGFRPLVLGRLGRGWVVASETCALDITGATPVRELEPGDFVRIHGEEVDQLPRLPVRPPRRCVFELVYFTRPDSTVFHRSVERVRRALGHELAREHPAPGADCVFSVPDSSNAMALGFSEESGIKLEHALIRNHYVGRTFIHPAQAGRMAKVKIKFNPVREVLQGKKVVVVDDSIVRGTTSRALVQLIRQAGAAEVHFRVASPPITGPCYYGIDTPSKKELIASSNSVEQIREHLGVDSLGYLSLDGMLRAAAGEGDPADFCHACFSGDYPTEFTISAKLCLTYLEQGIFPDQLHDEVQRHLKQLEQAIKKKFGAPKNPLLVSVRSGAAVSMPGMMETILNLGLNDETVQGLIAGSNNPRFAYDSYRRFVQMYGDVVFDLGKEPFEEVLDEVKRRRKATRDIDLPPEDLEAVVREFKSIIQAKCGAPFPETPLAQLWGAIEAVFKSWRTRRAVDYRKVHGIPDDLGTAVNVVAMVYGNLGDDSGTGVAFTRD